MTASNHELWIVGHDGSEGAIHAVQWVRRHARQRSVDVRFVRAFEIPALEFPVPAVLDDILPPTVSPDLEALVGSFAAAGIDAHGAIVTGNASHTLLEASEGASLLVIGSRGVGGFRRLLLGSVSHQCVAYTEVPTIVVPASAHVDRPIRRVVVGVDGSQRSQAALTWAATFAPPEATLEVVGAWSGSRLASVAVVEEYANESVRRKADFFALLDSLDASVFGERTIERRFVRGSPAQALLDASEDADLLVVGQRGRSGLGALLLGSVSSHVLHHSVVPVCVVPDPQSSAETEAADGSERPSWVV